MLSSAYHGEWKNIMSALDYVYVMLTFFVMYIGTRCFAREDIIYKAITVGGMVCAGVFLEALFYQHIGTGRLSVWDNPNTLVDRLAILIPFMGAAFYKLKGSMLWRGLNVLSLLAITAAVCMTRSRGGIAGLICGLLAVGVLYWPMCKCKWSYAKKMVLSVAAVMVVSAMALAITMATFSRGSSDTTRKYIMQASYQMFEKHPLAGVGLENYVAENMQQVKSMQEADTAESTAIGKAALHRHSHNVFLYLMATTGVIGLVGYVIFMLLIWCCLIGSVIRHKNMMLTWAMMAVIILLNVHGLVDLSILHRKISWMFFGMLGLTLALADMKDEICEQQSDKVETL